MLAFYVRQNIQEASRLFLFGCVCAGARCDTNKLTKYGQVVLLPFFSDVDQEDTFKNYIREPLLKHGAVKIFFGAQWNILFQRPEYLGEIFRGEDVFQKSGNQKKIPHSVLAEFLG